MNLSLQFKLNAERSFSPQCKTFNLAFKYFQLLSRDKIVINRSEETVMFLDHVFFAPTLVLATHVHRKTFGDIPRSMQ